MSMSAHGTVISKLRMRSASGDSLAMRQRLGSMLSAADLEPAGLPATAIVVIRSLRDPQPRRLRLMQAGQPQPLSWQQAVGQSIDALARRGARPAREFVADSAEAVVFMDRSELLACLARDWCSAAIASRWWWRSLARDPDIARVVLGEWLIHLEYAPAALKQLADSRDAIAFVQKLPPVSASTLLVGILDRFGLVELRRLLLEIAQRSAVPPTEDENQELAGDGAPHTASSALSSSIDPFVHWVPEVRGPPLVLEQRLLLGIGLMLRRAPAVVRSQKFARDVARWAAALPNEPGALQADALSNQVGRPTKNNENVYLGEDFVHAEPQSLQQPEPVHSVHVAVALDPAMQARQPEPTREDGAKAVAKPVPIELRTAPVDQASFPLKPEDVRFFEEQMAPELVAPDDERWIDTAQGGALFLINLGLFLELYADFSQPAKPGVALSIWDFIALVGESLVGHGLRDDPLWPLLAELAGRKPAKEPGLGFTPPPEWRMPVSWLTPFKGAQAWEWSGRARRLQVRHPAGFVVVDVAVPGRNYIDALDAELTPYRCTGLCTAAVRRAPRAGLCNNSFSLRKRNLARTRPEVSPHPRPLVPDAVYRLHPWRRDLLPEGEGTRSVRGHALRRWCGWLLPYVHARLETALGVSAEEVGQLLCACAARLRVTATHLDVHYTLAQLPIEVRLAGLDRDPGWVPAAGRYIKFHFD